MNTEEFALPDRLAELDQQTKALCADAIDYEVASQEAQGVADATEFIQDALSDLNHRALETIFNSEVDLSGRYNVPRLEEIGDDLVVRHYEEVGERRIRSLGFYANLGAKQGADGEVIPESVDVTFYHHGVLRGTAYHGTMIGFEGVLKTSGPVSQSQIRLSEVTDYLRICDTQRELSAQLPTEQWFETTNTLLHGMIYPDFQGLADLIDEIQTNTPDYVTTYLNYLNAKLGVQNRRLSVLCEYAIDLKPYGGRRELSTTADLFMGQARDLIMVDDLVYNHESKIALPTGRQIPALAMTAYFEGDEDEHVVHIPFKALHDFAVREEP
ncbi:MAG: hypothetical protein JWN38_327 [Candidatus Saccharibacteria bacterium]|nr:hypothetical protein [Candidatus Saccharibacteria bacterium]